VRGHRSGARGRRRAGGRGRGGDAGSRAALALALVATTALVAQADSKKKPPTLADRIGDAFNAALERRPHLPRFAFTLSDALPEPAEDDLDGDFEVGFWRTKTTVAVAADGTAAWVAADMAWAEPCGDESCPRVKKPDGYYHGTALLDGRGPWTALVWHVAAPMTPKDETELAAAGAAPKTFARRVLPGAEAAVAQLEGTLADPKALAASVSKRPDVVLYGSAFKERVVGGKPVAAQLLKWNLAFQVRGGLQAGVTASGTVAWIAANVDATSLKKKGAKPTPYRALFLYEKTDRTWQLVQIHFSF
jgi:ketosteroid isomerase-like protein